MRKLASIQRIWKIEPIEGADRIELAHVLGWQCVVNKGQFQPMDIGVYFEIDSFLPIRPVYEFMRSSSYKKTDIMGEGFKLRTMRFRGQISQGLLLPLSQFPEIPADAAVGDDVTELLGVRKWEIEERATTGGTVIGNLPYDIPHTDETRVQEEPELIQAFAGLEYYISTKMDGSSHSLGIDENGFHVTGHNYEYTDDGSSSFYELIKARGYQEKMEEYAHTLNLSSDDNRLMRYLKGETIDVEDLIPAKAKGWHLVCTDGFPLGWGKVTNGTLKNKYLPGWRNQSA